MGVRHPGTASCTLPERDPDQSAPPATALLHAETAYADVIRAAATYAVAGTAARAVGDEALATRLRVRAGPATALDPPVETVLALADTALEHNEHEDAGRRKWASDAAARER